jgi:hypothetical protein
LQRVKEEKNILHAMERRKATRTGHILARNCLKNHVIEGKIKGTERRGRRRNQLLDDVKKTGRYWKLKEEALDGTVWRARFGGGY